MLGSGVMVPGFEDQLTGLEAGAKRQVDVIFPADFPNAELAGKPASFQVEVKEVEEPKPVTLDDHLAKGQGFDDLAALEKTMREGLERHYGAASRARAQARASRPSGRDLPVRRAARHGRPRVRSDLEAGQEELTKPGELEREGKSEDEPKEEYRAIAERRVRLGLILSDIGQSNSSRSSSTRSTRR